MNEMNELRAVIFDLDGVITDTAEYHYLAWQQLADQEGLPFDRTVNEQLRGVSRRESLAIILAGRPVTEAAAEEMMSRKNSLYVASLEHLSPAQVLPGVLELLDELRAAGVKTAIASASKNTPMVLERLGITAKFDGVADGSMVSRAKPAPDVFLKAAELIDTPPGLCAVIEDAEAGVDGALAAGMWAIGLGPAARVGQAHVRFDDLAEVSLRTLTDSLETAAWTVHENRYDPTALNHKESVFTVGNGSMCVRGSFEEGHPGENAACFVHGVWDDMPLNFTELAALPRWWGFDIWIAGERFALNRGDLLAYDRRLDLRTGVLTRTVSWRAGAAAPVVELRFERLVSYAAAQEAAVRVRIRVEAEAVDVRVRAGLDSYVDNTGLVHWDPVAQEVDETTSMLVARTRATGISVALAAAVAVEGGTSEAKACDAERSPASDQYLVVVPGQPVTVTKFVAVVPDVTDADPQQRARTVAAAIRATGWDAWRHASDAAWEQAWAATDIGIDGDPEAQVAVRFNLFHMLIAAPRFTDRASIGAKTLSGYGYRHHTFWDTETFMLPMFSYTQPDVAKNMLAYRWHNLAGARAKAAGNGYQGAQYPWESAADGVEVTPQWAIADPRSGELVRIWTGDIEIHITADIAFAVLQYFRVSGDDAFLRDVGAEVILDGARFWASAATLEDDGEYHYRDVIGPDEYHDHVDDNAYTNHLAAWHLQAAGNVLAWLRSTHPAKAAQLATDLNLTDDRVAEWATIADRMHVPTPLAGGPIEQFAGYFSRTDADLALLRDPRRTESIQTILGLEETNQTQTLKQPDVLMLHYLLEDRFTDAQLVTDYEYYDPRTDHEHGSSLGPSISAVIACWAGHPERGYEHFRRAARADLLDVRHNTGDGIHGASAGGLWQAVVMGFGGLRVTEDGWTTSPMLPASWSRLRFRFRYRGETIAADIAG